MTKSLTASQENYLELIWRLSANGPVRISAIARLADVRLPSVTRAVNKLADAGLVLHESYGAVVFTDLGREAAESIVRRDTCLYRLLVELMGMSEEAASVEVCRIEHVISDEVLRRLETLIGHATDPASATWLKGLRRKLAASRPLRSNIKVGDNDPHAGTATNLHAEASGREVATND